MSELATVSVTLLLFAKARELVGKSSVIISLPSSVSSSSVLVSHILTFYPVLQRLGNTFVLSLNENYIDPEEEIVLRSGDELAVIPPISGEVMALLLGEPRTFVLEMKRINSLTWFIIILRGCVRIINILAA